MRQEQPRPAQKDARGTGQHEALWKPSAAAEHGNGHPEQHDPCPGSTWSAIWTRVLTSKRDPSGSQANGRTATTTPVSATASANRSLAGDTAGASRRADIRAARMQPRL